MRIIAVQPGRHAGGRQLSFIRWGVDDALAYSIREGLRRRPVL
jgi:hypothetical protein